jgi:hypothetical protein
MQKRASAGFSAEHSAQRFTAAHLKERTFSADIAASIADLIDSGPIVAPAIS